MATSSIKRVRVYDMDGTIVCSLHRYRAVNGKIDLPYWRANEHRAMGDSLLPLAAQYQADLQRRDTYTIIATARVIHALDAQFIREKLGKPDYMISRPAGFEGSGAAMKANGLAKFFNLRNFAGADWCFYEDNLEYLRAVCDRFRIRGVYVPSEQGH